MSDKISDERLAKRLAEASAGSITSVLALMQLAGGAYDALREQDARLKEAWAEIERLQAQLAEARKDGWILAMRLLQSYEVLDDNEVAARDAFLAKHKEQACPSPTTA